MRLAALACHVPERRIDAEAIITSAGGRRADARVFTNVFGIERVAASEPGESLAERFAPVLRRLAPAVGGASIDTLIYVHGLPAQYDRSYSPLDALCEHHRQLFAAVRLSYEVDQQNCAGLFWALRQASQLLAAHVSRCVAVVAGDCLSDCHLSHRYVPGCTLIGDAYAALVLDDGQNGMRIDDIVLRHRSEFASGLYGTDAEIRSFNQAHDEMVTEALDAVGFPWNGRERLLPHNVNKLIWLQFCRRCRLGLDRLQLDLLRDVGHCYTTDPVLLLQRVLATGAVGHHAVTLLSTGLGAYTGACRVQFQ
jgi:3-oxoacyl-[acyl-carrier-protein] synthase-3